MKAWSLALVVGIAAPAAAQLLGGSGLSGGRLGSAIGGVTGGVLGAPGSGSGVVGGLDGPLMAVGGAVQSLAPGDLLMLRKERLRSLVREKDRSLWLSSPSALNAWTTANELGLLVDIEAPAHGSYALIPVVEQMADRFPNLRIVLDHLFLPDVHAEQFGIDDRFNGFKTRDNITYKFTSLNMDFIREKGVAPEDVLRRAVDFYGADKIMWGSDIGTSSGTYAEMIERAKDAATILTDEEQRKVLHDTGRRICLG